MLNKINLLLLEERKANIPQFSAGDTIEIDYKISDGPKARVQKFSGTCIAIHNNSINSTFRLRKITRSGVAIELVFPLYSHLIVQMTVISFGRVRRAKLYYLRDREGKKAVVPTKRR